MIKKNNNISNSERFLKNRMQGPEASGPMARGVSQYRREILEDQVAQGQFREKGSTGSAHYGGGKTALGNVIGTGMRKTANIGSGDGGGGFRGSGGTVRQVPEIYSPLWLTSNLNLPRDRATINAWSRAFFALNPIVQNAITLHSTYPISKLNITCKDQKVQQFFEDMAEEISLLRICTEIAQEYWVLGEAFPYAELNEAAGKWNRIILQNPDYMVVKHSVVAGEPILSLRPDENLKKLVTSKRPADIQQRQRLDPSIVEHVKRGENIPLSNFYAHHIARKLNPYEVRGTGLITSCFRNLMLFQKLRESKFAQADNLINPLTLIKVGGGPDNFKPSPEDLEEYRQIFECHDEETEVLTDQGFKKYHEVMEEIAVIDSNTKVPHIVGAVPKNNIKIACFNPVSEELEYHQPSAAHLYDYDGEMYHFQNEKMDIKVTPNHRMWVQSTELDVIGDQLTSKVFWSFMEAEELAENPRGKAVRSRLETDNSRIVEVDSKIKKVNYQGKVWCFTVPTGLFVTRRNGKITIQGNSAQYDKDYKIITHDGVTVEPVGWNGNVIDINPDIEKLTKEIYIGLMVPQVLMDGGGDVTYSNAGITVDVLKQRYLHFREQLSEWIRSHLFAPISKINGFHEYKDGKKVLVVPDIEWNHMSLFDAGDYIQSLMNFRTQSVEGIPAVSRQTMYRSFGLDFEEENRKIKEEIIEEAILEREKQALMAEGGYTLAELRALTPDDIIEEKEAPPLPGEETGEEGAQGLDMALPGMGGGGGPPAPPPEAPLPEGGGEAPPE